MEPSLAGGGAAGRGAHAEAAPMGVRHEALHRHAAVLAEDRHLRAEDAHLRREAAALRRAAAAHRGRRAGATAGSSQSSRAVFLGISVGIVVLGLGLLAAHKAYDVLYLQPGFRNPDGTVDWAEVKRDLHQHITCGLSTKALRSLCQLIALAVAGFTFLWWKHMIQPVLGSLLVFAYIGVVALMMITVVGMEAFGDVSEGLSKASGVVTKVQGVVSKGTKDIDDKH